MFRKGLVDDFGPISILSQSGEKSLFKIWIGENFSEIEIGPKLKLAQTRNWSEIEIGPN
jgi:hypothetical protein